MEGIISRIPQPYREDIEQAIKILKNAGCREIFLFGSLAKGNIREDSDIDLAIRGCPADNYFRILGELLINLNHPVDLVNLDREDDFARYLEGEGELLYVT